MSTTLKQAESGATDDRDLLARRASLIPTTYLPEHLKGDLAFAIGETTLGLVLVAATDIGVCAVLLGDDPEALQGDLQDRFPAARLVAGDADIDRLTARIVDLVENPAADFDLPLDARGTAFQRRVWRALRGIPVGQTATYAEIADGIGAPQAVRAVGAACGANPIAVAIPCHRVVSKGGGLSGYRWGPERKRALLEREATA